MDCAWKFLRNSKEREVFEVQSGWNGPESINSSSAHRHWNRRTIILPVVLYGCENWSLTLREERRLRVFENTLLRRVYGPKRDEITKEWRKLHNEELSELYSLPNIVRVVKSRRMRWAGHVARMGEGRGVYRVLVGKPQGKRPFGRPRRRWENNTRIKISSGSGRGLWGLDGVGSG